MLVVQRFIALGMAFGLVLSDPAMEWLHHDIIPGTSNANASVTTHACGSRERHIPVDRIHPCGICLQRLQHSGAAATVALINTTPCCASLVPPAICWSRTCMLYLHREKRGPPAV